MTLILATYLGEATVRDALDSVARQSLERTKFELLVVENGPPCGTTEVVRKWRGENPDLQVRVASVRTPGLSHARNLGLSLARGEHVTYLDDDDAVSPNFLEVLLEAAAPGVIPASYIVDVDEGVSFDSVDLASPDLHNYYSGALQLHDGQVVPAEAVSEALSVNAAKLVPTSLARALRYREDLRSGEDFVYWTELFARTEICLSVTRRSGRGFYLRRVRQGSMSRKDLSYDFSVTQRLDCIAALDGLPIHTPTVGRVVRGKSRAQSGHLRNYLIAHPADRTQVIEDVEKRALASFDYTLLTRQLARDLAILYCFAPHQDASAMVAMRRIRERGEVVDVVSNNLNKVRKRDEWSAKAVAGFVDDLVMLDCPQAFSSWKPIRSFMHEAQEPIERMQRQKGTYRTVYSRSTWPASHFAAALFKVRNPNVRWVAEFSDPQSVDIMGKVKGDQMELCELVSELDDELNKRGYPAPPGLRTFQWCEWLPYVLAEEVVFTNVKQRDYMLGYCPEIGLRELVRRKSSVQHHPTLPPHFYSAVQSDYPLADGVRHVAYFGVFYATRGLREVMAALSQLHGQQRSKVRLHIFSDKPEDVSRDVSSAGLADVVVVNGYRPFLEFLNLTTRFDVLLVNDASTSGHLPMNPFLPSKLSDYLGSGSAIWSIVEPSSVLSEVETRYQSLVGDGEAAMRILADIADSLPSIEVQRFPSSKG